MVLVLERKLTGMLGTVQVTYQISRKEKLARSIYIGVWSRWSHLTAQMMVIFQVRVKISIKKIIEKRMICIFQGPGKPNRMKCVTVDIPDLFTVSRLWRDDRQI